MSPPRAPASTRQVTAILIALGDIRKSRSNSPFRILRPKPLEHLRDRRDREPDDVRPGSLDPVHEPGRPALDPVRTGLPHRLPRTHVPQDFFKREGKEPYPRPRELRQLAVAV